MRYPVTGKDFIDIFFPPVSNKRLQSAEEIAIGILSHPIYFSFIYFIIFFIYIPRYQRIPDVRSVFADRLQIPRPFRCVQCGGCSVRVYPVRYVPNFISNDKKKK